MDLWRPVSYRGVQLNDATSGPASSQNQGNMLERAVFGPVRGVGYTEKRSLADGRDASDVYLESRQLILAGISYGLTRAQAFDMMAVLRTAFSPTAAYTELPGAYGYLPLAWQESTNDSRFDEDPINLVRYRDLHLNVRPLSTPAFDIERDKMGGLEDRGTAIPWNVSVEAIDPRIYGDEITVYLDAADNAGHTGSNGTRSWTNRGTYPAPMKLLFVVAAGGVATTATFNVAGSIMKITVPTSTSVQVFRYDGSLKVLTVETAGLEVLRMDLLTFGAQDTHPLIPAGSSTWSFTTSPVRSISQDPGARIWFSEAYV